MGDPEAFLEGGQNVVVESFDDSVVDFDVDMKAKQQVDGKGQPPFPQNLLSHQDFFITALDEAEIDADGDGKDVELIIDQNNDKCDDATCDNVAVQEYYLFASGTSKIDISSDQGFKATQKNNGCDDVDGDINDVICNNTAATICINFN